MEQLAINRESGSMGSTAILRLNEATEAAENLHRCLDTEVWRSAVVLIAAERPENHQQSANGCQSRDPLPERQQLLLIVGLELSQ